MSYAIVIDGELIEARHLNTGGYLPNIDAGNPDWYLAENSDTALDAAKKYWEDMAAHDAKELICLVGEETIVDLWSRGATLDNWVDENVTPEGEFATYDGNEIEVGSMVDYLKGEYPDLTGWMDEILEGADDFSFLDDPDGETEDGDATPDYDDKCQIIAYLKDWQRVIDECGFEPTVAYRHN